MNEPLRRPATISASSADVTPVLQPRAALRRLRKLLAGAVAVIAFVTISALLLVAARLAGAPLEARTVNVVGRQRMLAVRAVTSVELLVAAGAGPNVQRELSESLRVLSDTHARLRDRKSRLGASLPRTAEMQRHLAHAAQLLGVVRAIAGDALRRPRNADASPLPRLEELRAAGRAWVSEMDAINGLLVAQRLERDAWLAGLPILLCALIIFTLGLSWLMLHEPALRLMATTIEALERERSMRERLALVAYSTTNSVMVMDPESRIEWTNEAFTRLSGYTLDEVLGKQPNAFLHGPQTDQAVSARIQQAIARGEGFKERIANYARDGRAYWLLVDCQPLHDAAGQLSGFMAVQSEITSMLELERKLTKQAERYDIAMTAASMGVWEWDVRTNTLDYDVHHDELYGIDSRRTAPLDTDWRSRVVPEDLPAIEASLARALRGEGQYAAQFRVRHADGQERWLSGTGVVIRDVEGRPTRMVGVNIDVTDRQIAETQRREIDLRLRKLAANLPGVLFQFKLRPDGTFCFPYASEGITELFGIAPERLLTDASGAVQAIHAEDRARTKDSMLESASTLGVWITEFRLAQTASDTRWVRGHATPGREADGSTVWYGVLLDSSLVKEAQRREREASASLEEAQTLARVGSWSYDVQTGAIDWSRQMYVLYGRDPALGPPRYGTTMSIYTEEDASWLRAAMERALQTGSPYSRTLRLKRSQNGVAVLHAEAKVTTDALGKTVRLFGTVMDMTAAVEREEALKRAQTLAEAGSRAKSEFLANMSHEIRTPMAAILGYVDLLLEPDLARAELREYATTIQRNARHLLELINEVLDLSKIEAGQMSVECIACSPAAIAREIVSFMRPRAEEKKLSLSLRFAGPIPSTIQSDPTRLRQILFNLVGNAIKFTEKGSVELVVALDRADPPALELQVNDTGIGIAPAWIGSLFRPFSQADSSTTRRFGGTGLGLSIAKHLSVLLGGGIEVSSTPGAGTSFTARVATGDLAGIPLTDCKSEGEDGVPHPSACAPAPRLTTPLAGLRLLLVEDGPDNQHLISLHLTRAGAIVEVLANGRRAVDRLIDKTAVPVDAVLMDMQMPVLDGYAATAMLRSMGYSGIILALTAHAMEGDREKCLKAGCDDYATKPIDSPRLIACILAHVRRAGGYALAPPAMRATIVSTFQDDPEMAELIAQFAGSLPARVALIAAAQAACDLEQLATLVHQLKGAGGGYGFAQITDAAQQIEHDLSVGADASILRASIADLSSICAAVRPRASHPGLREPLGFG